MLRASIEFSGKDADVDAIAQGAEAGDNGILHGRLLVAFAEAAVRGTEEELSRARNELREAAGPEVVVDAAGVFANFERMVRIADGTGIPVDSILGVVSTDVRDQLGLNEFQSRRVASPPAMLRILGPALAGIVTTGLRLAGRFSRR